MMNLMRAENIAYELHRFTRVDANTNLFEKLRSRAEHIDTYYNGINKYFIMAGSYLSSTQKTDTINLYSLNEGKTPYSPVAISKAFGGEMKDFVQELTRLPTMADKSFIEKVTKAWRNEHIEFLNDDATVREFQGMAYAGWCSKNLSQAAQVILLAEALMKIESDEADAKNLKSPAWSMAEALKGASPEMYQACVISRAQHSKVCSKYIPDIVQQRKTLERM